jgi:leucyl/phenylalanyl-tRNA--protein transferase
MDPAPEPDDRPVPRLGWWVRFPDPSQARRDGLLAVGGDLSVRRLLAAYRRGIFPWYEPGEPILWWSPDPRLILEPSEFHLSRSLRAVLRKGEYQVTFDRAFAQVIRACARVPRRGEVGTWIGPKMERAYCRLHAKGFAHSVETWRGGILCGGLYGIALGRCFFGESMFSARDNASKVALAALVDRMRSLNIELIDCQVTTEHLVSLGAKEIPRAEFLRRLDEALRHPTPPELWRNVNP